MNAYNHGRNAYVNGIGRVSEDQEFIHAHCSPRPTQSDVIAYREWLQGYEDARNRIVRLDANVKYSIC